MIRRYFTAGEVMSLTEVTYRRLDLWCRREIIRPSRRTAGGKGQRRLFTFRDVVEVQTIKSLTDRGVRLSMLIQCIERLRHDLDVEGMASFASTRLITDGRTVLRYVPKEDHLEGLDVYGQFAFAFGLGDEIGLLILKTKELGRHSRYKYRNEKEAGDLLITCQIDSR